MEIEIYCDESNQQLLSSSKPSQNRYVAIGGLWLPADKRDAFKAGINKIKSEEKCFGEAKWNKVCPSKLDFYTKLIDFFFEQGLDLRFRSIIIDSEKVDLAKYHQADQELGFYKFCYQLLKNWIEDFNEYYIFFDMKSNRIPSRLQILHRFLNDCNLLSKVHRIQALPSNQLVLMQLNDLLLGAVAAKFNMPSVSEAKIALIRRIEQHLNHKIMPTTRSVRKFNIFKIVL